MRVDPHYSAMLVQGLGASAVAEQTLTTELSSGLRVSTLSDDPVAAAANVGLSSSISRVDAFVKSSTNEQSLMQVTDSTLGDVVTQVTSALQVAVRAANGTNSTADFSAFAKQITAARDSVLGLANTAYQGQYVFSGSQGGTKPFAIDTTTDPATATYAGDAVAQSIETPTGQKVQVNVPGSAVFTSSSGDLLGTLNQLVSDLTAAANGTGSTTAIQADSTALTTALGVVSGQRAGLDSGLSQMIATTGYASSQETVLKAQQSTLLSADPAQVATDLKTAEVQHQALLGVTAALNGSQDLFDYLK